MSAFTILLMAGAVYVVWAIALYVQWQAAKKLNDEVYAKYHKDGTLKPTVTKEDFSRVFMQCEGPRRGIHLFAGALAAPFLIVIGLAIFNAVWRFVWNLTGQVDWFEVGELPHSLMIIFLYVAILIGVAAFAMWRYYAVGTMNLKVELNRLNGEN